MPTLFSADFTWRRLTTCPKPRRIWSAYYKSNGKSFWTRRMQGRQRLWRYACSIDLKKVWSFRHFLYDCLALDRVELRTLGKPILEGISSCMAREPLSFENASSWLPLSRLGWRDYWYLPTYLTVSAFCSASANEHGGRWCKKWCICLLYQILND